MFLEQGAVAKAAQQITPQAIERLWTLCDQYLQLARLWRDTDDAAKRDDVLADMARVDAAFHIQLLLAAGNRRLIKLVGDLHLMAFLFRRHAQIPRGRGAGRRWARAYREHCRIARALERRDGPQAAATMKRHLEDAKTFYLGVYDHAGRDSAVDELDPIWCSEPIKSLGPDLLPTRAQVRRRKFTRSHAATCRLVTAQMLFDDSHSFTFPNRSRAIPPGEFPMLHATQRTALFVALVASYALAGPTLVSTGKPDRFPRRG